MDRLTRRASRRDYRNRVECASSTRVQTTVTPINLMRFVGTQRALVHCVRAKIAHRRNGRYVMGEVVQFMRHESPIDPFTSGNLGLRNESLTAINGVEEIDQRLNRLNAGILPVPVNDLSRKCFCDTSRSRNGLPPGRPYVTKTPLKFIKDGFHAGYGNPSSGISQVPDTGSGLPHTLRMDLRSRTILAANLDALMGAVPELNTFKKIVDAGGPSNGTLGRIRNQEIGCSVDQLDMLAEVFGVEMWHLLVPGLDVAAARAEVAERARDQEIARKDQTIQQLRAELAEAKRLAKPKIIKRRSSSEAQ